MFRSSCATRDRKQHLPSMLSAAVRALSFPLAPIARARASIALGYIPVRRAFAKSQLLAGVTGSKSRELNGLGGEKFSNRLLRRSVGKKEQLLSGLRSGLRSSLRWSVGQCSNRAVVRSSRSPVAVGRPAEGGVASLRPWQIAIYEQ